MTTARSLLMSEILTVTHKPYSVSLAKEMEKVLDKYRIQAKPSEYLKAGSTARQALSEIIVANWKEYHGKKFEEMIKKFLDDYRMQLKKDDGGKKSKKFKLVSPKAEKEVFPVAEAYKSKTAMNGPAIKVKKMAEPLAGGPKKRHSSRSKCPKCNSMGVVLAQSSGGDGYFSCIYCGFQAYQSQLDSELNWPLAAELLGRCFDDGEGRE